MKRIALLLLLCALIAVPALAQMALTVGIDQETHDQWNTVISRFQGETGIKVTLHPYPANSLAQQVVLQGITRSGKMNLVMVHKDWGSSLVRYLADLRPYGSDLLGDEGSIVYMEGRPVGIWIPFAPDWFLAVLSWPDDPEAVVLFLEETGGGEGAVATTAPSKVSPEAVIASFRTTKIDRTEHNPKLDGALEALLGAAQATLGKTVGAMAADFMAKLPPTAQTALNGLASLYGIPFSASTATVTIVLEPQSGRASSSNVAALSALGVSRTSIQASTSLIKVSVPLAQLETIVTQMGGISFIRPPYTPYPLSIPGEGVGAIGADAFHSAGITGSGVKVAIIDLGFAGLSQAQARGDIPYSVQQHDLTGTGLTSGITHGTAIAEIVHEIAPGAQLYLIKIADEVDLDQAVTYCLNNGIDIINHSLGWYNTNFYDGTGTIAEIAERAISGGILWVNAGGNEAQSHWEGTFSDNNSDTWNDQSLTFYATSGAQVILYMTWNDWPQAGSDYDLYLYDPGSNLVASSTKHQTGTEEPTESIMTTAPTNGTYTVRIKGTGSKKIEVYNLYQDLSPAIAASSILAPGNVADVVTVGAIDYAHYTTGPLESYSSQGPTNDGRTKPDLCAPDNVSTGTSPYTSFAGTSGATPHATGAAALLLAQDPSLSGSALRARLLSQTVAMGSPYLYGRGRLVLSAPTPTNQPPTASFNVNPSSATVGSSVSFNASSSNDPDGHLVSYAWQFGDGATSSGVSVQHAYGAVGTYTVRLTVTDNDGATDSTTRQVSISVAPKADLTVTSLSHTPLHPTIGENVTFTFLVRNQGNAAAGLFRIRLDGAMSAVNTYVSQLSAGASTNLSLSLPLTQSTETFRVTVDDLGQVAESNEGNNEAEEIVEAETQQPLIADAGGPYAGAPGQSIAFDASGSSGVISNYQWDFGDGATGQGVMATHAYGAAGSYTVTLTVTGTNAQQATDTTQVTITEPGAGGWTTPTGDSGSGWESREKARDRNTSTYASNGRYDKNDIGAWTPYLVGTHDPIYVNRVRVHVQSRYFTHVDIDIYNIDTHSWHNVYDGERSGVKEWVTTNEFGTVHTDKMRVRLQLMKHRGFGYLEVPIYEMQFYQVGAPPAPSNQPPTASFTYAPAAPPVGTQILFNGSGSSDPDGQVVSYAWRFGDGSTGSGVTVQHAYAIAGTYTVRLTVTDDDGATGTTTRQVAVGQARPPLSIRLSLPKTSYQVGEPIVIDYNTNREAYVYICDVDASGKVTLLFPNYREPNNRIPAGAHSVPSSGYTLLVSEPTGTETLYAFAATSRLPNFPTSFGGGFTVLSYNPSSFLGSVQQTMQTQFPTGEWAQDSLTLSVVSSAPQSGTLWVTSSPQGATVTIDGTPVGTTPAQVSVAAGMHTVTLSLTGYQEETRQVNILAGQTAYLQVPLTALAQNQPPFAVFNTFPSYPTVGQVVTFDGSSSTDPDGWLISYLWDFGDGTSAAGVQASHSYQVGGTYLVRLTVADNQGATHTTTKMLSVASGAPPPPWGGTGEPQMGGTPGIFVWGTDTWHITVNAGAYWTSAHSYRLELRTDASFVGVNRSTSGGVVPLGVVPTPTGSGKTLIFEGSLQTGSIDYTFTVPDSKSVWMSLKLDIDGDGDLDESTSFVYLRTSMVHPPNVPFVVGLPSGGSGPLVPSMNFRLGSALVYTETTRFVMWTTNIATLEGY